MDDLNVRLTQIDEELRYLRNDSPLSSEEKKEKIDKFEQEKKEIENYINFFDNINRKIDELKKKGKLSKEEKKELVELNKSIDSKRKEYNKKYQGKLHDVLSSYFGQIDKRIHNRIYKNNGFWRNKSKRVNDRYANIGKYFIKNVGVSLGILLAPGFVSMFVPAIAPYALGAFTVYFSQTVVKTVAAMYNKSIYGGPRLVREYPIEKNSYFKNIENSWGKVLNNKTLFSDEVRQVYKVDNSKHEELRKSTEENLKSREEKNNGMLNLVSSIIASADVDSLSDSKVKEIIDLVENNNLFDKLDENIKNKYLLIKEIINKKNVDNTDALLNSINKELEEIDISVISQEKKEKIVKLISDNKWEDKLTDKAHDKYNQLLSSMGKNETQEDFHKKVEFINSYISNFQYSKIIIKDYEDMFKYVLDNDLEKELGDNNKKKYQELKVIYNVIIKIRDFDLNNFDVNKANEIINYVRDNKITKKLNNESYRKYQKIINNLNILMGDKEKDNNKKKKDNDYKEKLIAFSNMLKVIDLSKLNLNEISSLIKYVKDNNLEDDLPDILDKLNKIYDVKIKNKPKMEDYGNKNIGISGNIKFIAEEFIKHPPKITKDMSQNERDLIELARKIRNNNASSSEVNKYIMLVYELVDQKSFIEDYEDYLMEEYNKYQSDKDEYEGKKAK